MRRKRGKRRVEGGEGETYAYICPLMESVGLGAPLLLALAVVALEIDGRVSGLRIGFWRTVKEDSRPAGDIGSRRR
jgi:hypothetical protein